jgi:hypothetical protein
MTTIRRSLPDLRLLQGRLAPLLPRAVQRLGLRAARQARLSGLGRQLSSFQEAHR